MSRMKQYKVRFNLSRGANYMKWKVTHPSGMVEYLSPDDWQLFMNNCTLKNNRKTAERIFNGEDKSVCSWILCEEFGYKPYARTTDVSNLRNQIKYNPRVAPYWTYSDDSSSAQNVDGKTFPFIFSQNKQLFTHFKPI